MLQEAALLVEEHGDHLALARVADAVRHGEHARGVLHLLDGRVAVARHHARGLVRAALDTARELLLAVAEQRVAALLHEPLARPETAERQQERRTGLLDDRRTLRVPALRHVAHALAHVLLLEPRLEAVRHVGGQTQRDAHKPLLLGVQDLEELRRVLHDRRDGLRAQELEVVVRVRLVDPRHAALRRLHVQQRRRAELRTHIAAQQRLLAELVRQHRARELQRLLRCRYAARRIDVRIGHRCGALGGVVGDVRTHTAHDVRRELLRVEAEARRKLRDRRRLQPLVLAHDGRALEHVAGQLLRLGERRGVAEALAKAHRKPLVDVRHLLKARGLSQQLIKVRHVVTAQRIAERRTQLRKRLLQRILARTQQLVLDTERAEREQFLAHEQRRGLALA